MEGQLLDVGDERLQPCSFLFTEYISIIEGYTRYKKIVKLHFSLSYSIYYPYKVMSLTG